MVIGSTVRIVSCTTGTELKYDNLIGCEGIIVQDPFRCCKDDRYRAERTVLVRFVDSYEEAWVPVADLREAG